MPQTPQETPSTPAASTASSNSNPPSPRKTDPAKDNPSTYTKLSEVLWRALSDNGNLDVTKPSTHGSCFSSI